MSNDPLLDAGLCCGLAKHRYDSLPLPGLRKERERQMGRKPSFPSAVILLVLVGLAAASGPAQSQYHPSQYYQYQQQPYQYYHYQQQPQQYSPYQYQQQPAAQSQYYQYQQQPAAQYQYQQPYATATAAVQSLPSYCSQNNAATGAVVGSLLGAALGGAIGGGRGAMIGAGSGMLFGGLSGAQADAQCQQFAAQQAYQLAAAQQAAIEAQIAQQAATRAGMLTLPESAYQPVSADYQTPSNGRRHRITVKRLNSYSDPASRQICDTFTRIDADLDSNTSTSSTARRCKGADGQWRDVG